MSTLITWQPRPQVCRLVRWTGELNSDTGMSQSPFQSVQVITNYKSTLSFVYMLKVKVPEIYMPPLTGKSERQRFTIRSGLLTSTSSRRRGAISGHPLPEWLDLGLAVAAQQTHLCTSQLPCQHQYCNMGNKVISHLWQSVIAMFNASIRFVLVMTPKWLTPHEVQKQLAGLDVNSILICYFCIPCYQVDCTIHVVYLMLQRIYCGIDYIWWSLVMYYHVICH